MASITLSITDKFKAELGEFHWINWSDVAREEFIKKRIFQEYLKTGKVSDEDLKFCDKIDWHPVDELPLKEEYVKELNKRKKGPFVKYNSVDDFFRKKNK